MLTKLSLLWCETDSYFILLTDLSEIDVNTFLGPFLDVIRSEDTTGPITGVALSSVNKFLSYGLIGMCSTNPCVSTRSGRVGREGGGGVERDWEDVMWDSLSILWKSTPGRSNSLYNKTYMYYYGDLLEIHIMFQFCFALYLSSSTCT